MLSFTAVTRRAIASGIAVTLAAAIALTAPRAVPARADTAAAPGAPAMVRGVNLSGGDFGERIPGDVDVHYTYPTKEEIDYYAERGFNAVRLPFLWERLQHELNGPLDTKPDGTGDFDRVRQVVAWITGRGMIAILDPHNYAGRVIDGTTHKVGTPALPVSALEDFWVRLAEIYKNDERVWFGLMNEPFDLSPGDWKAIAQTVTNTIRATGARNFLLVPGTAYTGAHTWVTSYNAEAMATFVDPADNFAFEVHQYLDIDSSGKQGTCTPGAGASRLKPFIEWAKAVPGRKGFLGEFAAGDASVPGQEQCAKELSDLLTTAQQSGVFIGWAVWGGGLWWNLNYIFRIEPPDLSKPDTGIMRMLRKHMD
jgi:endoglucanase